MLIDQPYNLFKGAEDTTLKIKSFLIPAMCKTCTTSTRKMVDVIDPPLESVGYLTSHWQGNFFIDDCTLLEPNEFRVDLRIRSLQEKINTGLILRWNDINNAYNRTGMFIGYSADLEGASITPRVIEID